MVESNAFPRFVIAKLEEVADARVVFPCTSKFPVVVAPPEIVRPPF